MANVYVSGLKVPRTPRNGRQYNGLGGTSFTSVSTGGITVPPTATIPTEAVEFTATATPTLSSYNTAYAPTHGQFPRIELYIDNGDGTRYRSAQMPQFTTLTSGNGLDDLIDTVFFDLGDALNGWILIQ